MAEKISTILGITAYNFFIAIIFKNYETYTADLMSILQNLR